METQADQQRKPPTKTPESNLAKTILFADDNATFLKCVAAMLGKSGYNVFTASDGKGALEKASAFVGVIHLLLTDVDMPGMTGIHLAIQVNRERPDTKILLISGIELGQFAQDLSWQFLQKPFKFDMLRDCIRHFLIDQPLILSGN